MTERLEKAYDDTDLLWLRLTRGEAEALITAIYHQLKDNAHGIQSPCKGYAALTLRRTILLSRLLTSLGYDTLYPWHPVGRPLGHARQSDARQREVRGNL